MKGKIGRKYDPEKGFTVQGLTVRPERSNAKNEKTRLYQTYDNLLDEKEIRKKYNYVLNDKNTDEKAKGRAVRALLNPSQADYATYKKVAERQMELQKQKSGAGFAAGFVNSTGGNVAKIAAKGIKNEQARKNWMDTLNHLKETQEAHPTAGTLGAVTGEFAKAGAGYMTIGKAAEGSDPQGHGRAWQEDDGKHSTGHCTEGGGQNSAEPEKREGGESGGRASGTAGGGHNGEHADDDCGRDGRRKEPQGDCEGCWKAGGNGCGV